MSRNSYATVSKKFVGMVTEVVGVVAAQLGLEGPEAQSFLLQSVTYGRNGLRYQLLLDPEGVVTLVTEVEVDLDIGCLRAPLPAVAVAAGVGGIARLPSSAGNLRNLQRSLLAHAECIRMLHPELNGPTRLALMRQAGARAWRW